MDKKERIGLLYVIISAVYVFYAGYGELNYFSQWYINLMWFCAFLHLIPVFHYLVMDIRELLKLMLLNYKE